ncbi:MAG: murein hydrolase activator EnvC family protein, partial [Acidimicrobiia bacterium]
AQVSHQDGNVLEDLSATRSRLATRELTLVLARDEAGARATDADDALDAVASLKAEQERTRAALRERIHQLQSEADALAAEQAKLEQLIRERLAALAKARAARAAKVRAKYGSFRRVNTGQGVSAAGFIWPVKGWVTSPFGPRWGRMHTGIDVAAPGGTPIGAAKAGHVLFAGWLGGYGNMVALDHGDDLVTLYAHQSRLGVVEGQEVVQGQVVGYVGTTGRSTGNHLHFEVRIDTRPVNPRPYLP